MKTSRRDLYPNDDDNIYLSPDQYLQTRRRSKLYGRYSVVYHQINRVLAKHTPQALPTALALQWLTRDGNQVKATQEKLSKELGLSIQTIARHLKQLREIGLIVPDEEVPVGMYRIHPLFSWVGDGHSKDAYYASLPADHPFKQLEKVKEG